MPSEQDPPRESASMTEPVRDATDDAGASPDREIEDIARSIDLTIKVIGCGGAGSNTVDRCMKSGLRGAHLCAVNTDSKHLLKIKADKKVLIGKTLTKGLGAGARPEIGEKAALESEDEMRACVSGANITFVTAGMGGGTGTSAAQVASRLAKSSGSLTVGVVTLPFRSEGELRMENAMAGLSKLARVCDTTIVIPNDILLELVPRLPVEAAFNVADELLVQTISGLTEMLTESGLVNVDFADLKTILVEGGISLIGVGDSSVRSDERLESAVSDALNCPLLGKMDLKSARGALVRIVGGPDMSIEEAAKAAEMVTGRINPSGRLIWGCSVRQEMEGRVRVLIIVTGAQSKYVLLTEGEDPVMYPTNVDYRGKLNIPSSRQDDEDNSMFTR